MDTNSSTTTNILTEGGTYVDGNVTLQSGDFVGRDKIVGYTSEQVASLLIQVGRTLQPKPFDGSCPYVGLSPFFEKDASLFYGREVWIEKLVKKIDRAQQSRLIVVAGPSGSGKSSLVRAGVIPALKRGAHSGGLSGSERWIYTTLKPQRDPIEQLAIAISKLGRSPKPGDYIREKGWTDPSTLHKAAVSIISDELYQKVVICVDQFEEIFSSTVNENERAAFLKLLTYASKIERGCILVLVTIRSDFIHRCSSFPEFNELLNEGFIQISPMSAEDLIKAIILPAQQVRLDIEDILINRIIMDMKDEAGMLPLMQFTLTDLFWYQREKGGSATLNLVDYIERGGIFGSLKRHADAEFSKLDDQERDIARNIFSNLIEIDSGEVNTRRITRQSELILAGDDVKKTHEVIEKLSTARLITIDTDSTELHITTITLAHEKLIEAWPWLAELIQNDRDIILLKNHINTDASYWDSNNRDISYLYGRRKSEDFKCRLEAQKVRLSALAEEFLIACERSVPAQPSKTIIEDPVSRNLGSIEYTTEQVSKLISQSREESRLQRPSIQNPYIGLRAFQESDSDKFYGREHLVQEVINRISISKFLMISGPSGSGKTSIMRAGVIPVLQKGALFGSENWIYQTVLPGSNPIESLAGAVSRICQSVESGDTIRLNGLTDPTILYMAIQHIIVPNGQVFIFVDQFEEVFTLTHTEQERSAFINLLISAVNHSSGTITIVISLRSDFLSECSKYPELLRLSNRQFLLVGSMSAEELTEAISQPALASGIQIESALMNQLIADTGNEPGALPLLQFALNNLVSRETAKGSNTLTLSEYVANGSMHKILEHHANSTLAKFSLKEQRVARNVFSHLITIGQNGINTRRTVLLDDLLSLDLREAEVEEIISKLTDARLLTVAGYDGKVEVTLAHEALIGSWAELRKLVVEERDLLVLRNQLDNDANLWNINQRDVSYLYRGTRLAKLQEQLAISQFSLTSLERMFVETSILEDRKWKSSSFFKKLLSK